jgi:hypothetical protein
MPMLVILACWLVYVTVQGGDNMVGGRMYVPVLPLFFAALVGLLPHPGGKAAIPLVVSALALSLVFGYLYDRPTRLHAASWRAGVASGYAIGQYLRNHFPQDTLVALNPAGAIPFYSQMPTIDMLGLNNYHIAHYGERDPRLRYGHQVGDGKYVLSQEPDIVLLGAGSSRLPGPFISDQEIWHSTEFWTLYAPVKWGDAGWAYIRAPNSIP